MILTVFTIRLGQGLGSWNVSVSSRTLNVSVSVSSATKCPTSRSRLGPVRLGSRPERSRAHPCKTMDLKIFYPVYIIIYMHNKPSIHHYLETVQLLTCKFVNSSLRHHQLHEASAKSHQISLSGTIGYIDNVQGLLAEFWHGKAQLCEFVDLSGSNSTVTTSGTGSQNQTAK